MRAPSRRLALLMSATAAVLAGCGVPTQENARVAPVKEVPAVLLSPPPSTTTTTVPVGPATALFTLCLAQSGGPLVAVSRRLPVDATLDDILRALARPPTTEEQSAGLNTAVTPGITSTVSAGVAQVVLDTAFGKESATDQLNAVAQIVCTLTSRPGIGQVQFQLKGATTEVPRGDGSTTSKPVSRDDYPKLIPASIP